MSTQFMRSQPELDDVDEEEEEEEERPISSSIDRGMCGKEQEANK